MKNVNINRLGEVKLMNCGEEATIIKYEGYDYITVEFKKYNEIVKCQYGNFELGTIKSKYAKTVYDIGYLGEGNYKTKINGKDTLQYKCWFGIFTRCYNSDYQERFPTYIECSICEEWLNFQTFAKWFDENYYECEGQRMELDKDILCKNNKVYSPENCVFVPNRINVLFTKSNATRGKYPIGVNLKDDKFMARCNTLDNREYLGTHNTPEIAFEKYKAFKEDYIKKEADNYISKIPFKLYEAMYRYKVEIDD